MVKKLTIALFVLIAIAAAAIFIWRFQIIQYSAEAIIRKALPDFVRIETINFDFKNNTIRLNGFKIVNPPNSSNRYLLKMQEVRCVYKMKGKKIIDGLEIDEPVLERPTLYIERLHDGRLNLVEMQGLLERSLPARSTTAASATEGGPAARGRIGDRKMSDLIKLPEIFDLKDGKVIFIDRYNLQKPHMLSFENINGTIFLKLNDIYSKVLNVSSTGVGYLNGNKDEIVKWTIALNPNTPKLTMSNRFEVSGVDILPFAPYYDMYSPFVFTAARFSGTLVFDFDNGNIGSTNEVRLSDFKFYIKRGFENAQFWDTTVPDIAKYLTTPHGEIVFDFKIKGDMENPKFYLGPIAKQAVASMTIEKISEAIQRSQSGGAGGPKSDIEKAKEYIDLFKGLIDKK